LAGGPNISYEAEASERVRSANAIGPSPQINNNTAAGRTPGFDHPVHKNVRISAFASSKEPFYSANSLLVLACHV